MARKAQEQSQAERRRKGVLTGREIFSEVRPYIEPLTTLLPVGRQSGVWQSKHTAALAACTGMRPLRKE